MKCINKRRGLLGLLLVLSVFLYGCGEADYSFAYNPFRSISSYQMADSGSSISAEPFAADLCVTATDVSGSADVSEAAAAGLFDINNTDVMVAKSVHERLYPASLTKVMTALVALKHGRPEDMITVSPNAAGITESGATLCGLQSGDTLTMNQALHALLMKSANDAGIAIAEHISGTVEDFAELMNQEAVRLGATNSHFVNPHGLHDENHYTTAYDLYLIFQEAMQYELFMEIIQTDSYTTTYSDKSGGNKTLELSTTNQFLSGNYMPPEGVNVLGGKTGTTSAAGSCLILLSKDNAGNPYISVLLKCPERSILYDEMKGLLSEISK